MRLDSSISIAGAGCVLPSGLGIDALWQAALEGRSAIGPLHSTHFHSQRVVAFGHVADEVHQRCRKEVPANLQRYCPPPVTWGVSAVRQALEEAGLQPRQDRLRYGLYCCQGGYTHPSLDSYAELLHECNGHNGLDLCRLARRVLQERALDPFLVLKSLSNGLLGIVSLANKFECECNAYMQGVAGNLAALQEACAALQNYRIDVAVIVGAGSELDGLALSALAQAGVISASGSREFLPFDQDGSGGVAGEGAAALVLQRSEDLAGPQQVCLSGLSAHAELAELQLPAQPVDLLLCGGTGNPAEDRRLSTMLAGMAPAHVSSSQPVTGILSAAPSLAELILARSALQAQRVPPIAGLRRPITADLPFVIGASRPAALRHCAIVNRDDNGFSACYQLQLRTAEGIGADA
ncbi:beta-ketoacyl synthase [Pseudomonas sp. CrR25]|nr:beta-ketoacyl synthase [Pseudomonas sp. CrR25]